MIRFNIFLIIIIINYYIRRESFKIKMLIIFIYSINYIKHTLIINANCERYKNYAS